MIQKAKSSEDIKQGNAFINNNGLKIVTGTRTVSPEFNEVPDLAAVSGEYVSRHKFDEPYNT